MQSSTLIAITFTPNPTPAMPDVLLPVAATTPATCVPCASSSFVDAGSHSLDGTDTKAVPGAIAPVRSGCVGSMPVSSTATVTLDAPRATSQALSTDALRIPHWPRPTYGSVR